jgi:hypothetical protein
MLKLSVLLEGLQYHEAIPTIVEKIPTNRGRVVNIAPTPNPQRSPKTGH